MLPAKVYREDQSPPCQLHDHRWAHHPSRHLPSWAWGPCRHREELVPAPGPRRISVLAELLSPSYTLIDIAIYHQGGVTSWNKLPRSHKDCRGKTWNHAVYPSEFECLKGNRTLSNHHCSWWPVYYYYFLFRFNASQNFQRKLVRLQVCSLADKVWLHKEHGSLWGGMRGSLPLWCCTFIVGGLELLSVALVACGLVQYWIARSKPYFRLDERVCLTIIA